MVKNSQKRGGSVFRSQYDHNKRLFASYYFFEIENNLFPRYIIKINWMNIELNDCKTMRLSQVRKIQICQKLRERKKTLFAFSSPNVQEEKNHWLILYKILLGSSFHDNKCSSFCLVSLFFFLINKQLITQIKRLEGKNSRASIPLSKVLKQCQGLLHRECS